MAQWAPKHVGEYVIINTCIFIVYVHFVGVLKTKFIVYRIRFDTKYVIKRSVNEDSNLIQKSYRCACIA